MTAVRRAVTALTVGLLLAGAVAASAQIFVVQSLERYFRVEWRVTRDRKGPAVEVWLPGDVRRNDRAFFSSSVPEWASYRVQVLSFDWACDGGGGGM